METDDRPALTITEEMKEAGVEAFRDWFNLPDHAEENGRLAGSYGWIAALTCVQCHAFRRACLDQKGTNPLA